LYHLFGGYWGYLAAPIQEVEIQRLVLIARMEHDAAKEAEINAKTAEIEQAAERSKGRYGRG